MEQINQELDNEHIKQFSKELQSITNDDIRFKTIRVLLDVGEKFWTAPASSTGKYHPNYALGEGGLVRHTKAAVMIANSLLDLVCVQDSLRNEPKDIEDYIRAALILHDCCKSGISFEDKYTAHEHPLLVGELIEDLFGQDNEFTIIVRALISSHMGQWTTCKWNNIVLPEPTTVAQKFVHICDYLASRKFLEVNFGEDEI